MIIGMEEILLYVRDTGKYAALMKRWDQNEDAQTGFEVLFAYQCEIKGLDLNYEVKVNHENNTSVDFQFFAENGRSVNIELVRPDHNEAIQEHLGDQGLIRGLLLTSNSEDEDFRPEAQYIRQQWALLEKAKKFPDPEGGNLNIVVTDCSNLHVGGTDGDDVALTMYGCTQNPVNLRYWEGEKIRGMWEEGYSGRNSNLFNERVSAVIFCPEQRDGRLDEAFIAMNPKLGTDNWAAVVGTLKEYSCFSGLRPIPWPE